MEAEIKTIYQSPICTVQNFLCQCKECTTSGVEQTGHFSMAYIRKGSFGFKVYRNELEAYSGLFLICKPGFDHRVRHIHDVPDQCTIFSFAANSVATLTQHGSTLDWFFRDPDIHAILVKATPEMELMHQLIFNELHKPRQQHLWLEQMMTELFLKIISAEDERRLFPSLSNKQKIHYLPAIETIKTFMYDNYATNVKLSELAAMAHMSPFHFSRLFKKMTTAAPYEYLTHIRLKQAQLQLMYSRNTVTDIAFSTGFNSLEHFSASYKKHYGKSPLATRS
ncbi:hypothetical protein DCC81_24885 [Chitinophaga parva]|uniref:HTH araC/xylS-type domain-containing protein n=1 Tax=Chitinophaga parva TaxID=2169414 RepID=A0A2T7BBR0_9BACT|nr:helix-turn-helix transcriptional regulator [Chitinophaga parva]PUZ21826.1 hypothetical protein DCC81_24885 [Chitinophaga parva]